MPPFKECRKETSETANVMGPVIADDSLKCPGASADSTCKDSKAS